MTRLREGRLIYFPADQWTPFEHDADQNPRKPDPTHCPLCGRALVYVEWNEWPVYPGLVCDGWVGDIPILGSLHRMLAFGEGIHYTWKMPPLERGRHPSEVRYDRYTGRPVGGPEDGS